METIYFDNAATTQLNNEVIDVITNAMKINYGNPSSIHKVGRSAKAVVEKARKNIAKQLHVTASEIVFTSGGSEADNLILNNAVNNLGITHIITSKIEHHAVLHTINALKSTHNIKITFVNLLDDGMVDLHHLESVLKATTDKILVSLMYVNNEIGTILNVKEVANLCKEHNALFHSDSVQAIGHYPINLQEIPIDFMVASAHKFHGPKGVGFAYFKKGIGILPMLTGGGQERGARAGTENVHSILGMDKALELANENLEKDVKYVKDLKHYFITKLTEFIPNIAFNGNVFNDDKSAYSILSVRFPIQNDMLLFMLDIKGIAASGGSACQSGSNKGSHVLQTILPETESQKTSIRFSFSKYNNKSQVDKVILVLKEILQK